MNIPDEIKYDDMIDLTKWNHNEYLLNDNNILFIHNESLFKLVEINENSETFFEDLYVYIHGGEFY